VKDGKRYRYYIGTRTEQGRSTPWRLPAHDIEIAVIKELQRFLGDRQRITGALGSRSLKVSELKEAIWAAKQAAMQVDQTVTQRDTILKLVKQVRISDAEIAVEILLAALMPDGPARRGSAIHRLKIPIEQHPRAGPASIIVADAAGHETQSDPALIKAIARGVVWFEELATSRIDTVKAIADRDGVTDRYVSQLIELAFLSPRIVEKALGGAREVRVSTKQLVFDVELGSLWSEQERRVFAAQP
jgi:hypothetical protein